MSPEKTLASLTAIALVATAVSPTQAQEPAAVAETKIEPAQTCLANAGDAAFAGATLAAPIDGSKFRKESDLKKALGKGYGKLAYVKNGTFKGWKMSKLKGLNNICFENIDFSESNWKGAALTGVGFIGVKLTGANMAGARLPQVLFRTTSLDNVNATGADFSNGQMDGGWAGSLENLDVRNASFNGFRFVCGKSEADGCPFNRAGVKITGADFSNANLVGFALWDSDWTGVKLDNAVIAYDQAGQFNGAVLNSVIIAGGAHAKSIDGTALATLAGSLSQGPGDCEKVTDAAERFFCEQNDELHLSYVDDIRYLTGRGMSAQATGAPLARYQAAIGQCQQLAEDRRGACFIPEVRKRRGFLIVADHVEWPLREDFAAFAATSLDIRSPQLLSVGAQISGSLAGSSTHMLLMKRIGNFYEIRARFNGDQGGSCRYTNTTAAIRGNLLYANTQLLPRARTSGGTPIANLYGERASFDDRLFGSDAGMTGTLSPCPDYRDLPMKKLPMLRADFDRLWSAAIM